MKKYQKVVLNAAKTASNAVVVVSRRTFGGLSRKSNAHRRSLGTSNLREAKKRLKAKINQIRSEFAQHQAALKEIRLSSPGKS